MFHIISLSDPLKFNTDNFVDTPESISNCITFGDNAIAQLLIGSFCVSILRDSEAVLFFSHPAIKNKENINNIKITFFIYFLNQNKFINILYKLLRFPKFV